jgi:hypothetical protein
MLRTEPPSFNRSQKQPPARNSMLRLPASREKVCEPRLALDQWPRRNVVAVEMQKVEDEEHGPGRVAAVRRGPRSTFDLFAIVKQIVDAKGQFRSSAEPWADTC